ncbi:hypothetical protein EK21DRAFT_99437 [Setomelanomma holmii]|uniref:Mannosyltransferase n=1 Tax=Setomelanomma holmii TaxID=210430 RepID=A0A9P4HD90_9PLEO|nr:hypothetical protein EK21DRAFT_99437 [Setomelanomma holmii]
MAPTNASRTPVPAEKPPQLTAPLAFAVFVVANVAAAFFAPIQDCDEVFNYWESTHYLNHGYGLQTWEYSPEYAIRSWTYTAIHSTVIWIGTLPFKILGFGQPKVVEFYFLRITLALVCALCQTRLYSVIARTMNPRVAIFFALALVFSPGMYHAAPAYLPSTFAMYTTMLGFSSFMDWSGGIKTASGIMWFALGTTLGWPFAGALILPFLKAVSKPTLLRSIVFISPFYLWLAIFTVQPHKEERFMYPVYPALALNAAMSLHILLANFGSTDPSHLVSKIPVPIKLAVVSIPLLLSFDVGILRTIGTFMAYSAPLNVYQPLHTPGMAQAGDKVCLGKEWYRFPSSFSLPHGVHAKFVKSEFSGLLPGEFIEANVGFGLFPGTWLIPPGMNDENLEDVGKYTDINHCTFLVDSRLPSSSPTTLEPDYISDSAHWEKLKCVPFLDASETHLLSRLLYVPGLPFIPQKYRRKWGDYCLLRRRTPNLHPKAALYTGLLFVTCIWLAITVTRHFRTRTRNQITPPSTPNLEKRSPFKALDRPPGVWPPSSFTRPTAPPYPDWSIETTKPLPYRPFRHGPKYNITMGLRTMHWDEWIELDNQFLHFHDLKARRIAERGEKCCRTAPEVFDAAVELLEELCGYLPERYPSLYGKTDVGMDNLVTGESFDIVERPLKEDPMAMVGRLVQDDLAIMIEKEDGLYYLLAGSILLAGFWRLEDKFGMPLSEIHTSGDVPGFKEKLEKGMLNFFRRIQPQSPVLRNNYFIQVDDKLAWSESIGPEDSEGIGWFTAEKNKAIENHWFRSERQSLRRLPRSGGVVFTIRTYFHRVTDICKEPYVPGRLASAVRSWGDDVSKYKGRERYGDVLLEYLDMMHEEQVKNGLDLSREEEVHPYPY